VSQSFPPFGSAPSAAELFQHGVRCHQAGRLDEADAAYRQALALEPAHADALHLLGLALHQRRQHEAGLENINQAIRLRSDRPHYYNNAATALCALWRLDEAEAACRTALRLNPNSLQAQSNLGMILRAAGRLDEAEACYRAALQQKPDFAEAYNNLGNVLGLSGRYAEAEPMYRRALQLAASPGLHNEATYNLSLVLLVTGRFEEGWRHYEWRFGRGGEPVRQFPVPMWDGRPQSHRTLFLHAEQGFGDTLQFCRYVPLAAQRIKIVLEVQPSLKRLLSALPGIARIIAYGEAPPPVDYHLPLLSMPFVMGTQLDTVPGDTPYLSPDPALAEAWGWRLAAIPGRKVGLVWAGNPRMMDPNAASVDRRRSVTLDQLAPLATIDGISFVSLQLGPPAAQAAVPPPGMALYDFTAEITDFADTAALIANLDLVISVDTSVAHLAGALGKPVWLLNRFDTCWRWLEGREDSPWYPTLRQFRQQRAGDWDAVAGEVRAALEEFARRV
jgi:tetratricopeptide (TPR) repeat protein